MKSQTVKWTGNLVGERQLPFEVQLDRQCSFQQSILASNTIMSMSNYFLMSACGIKLSRFLRPFTPWIIEVWKCDLCMESMTIARMLDSCGWADKAKWICPVFDQFCSLVITFQTIWATVTGCHVLFCLQVIYDRVPMEVWCKGDFIHIHKGSYIIGRKCGAKFC